MALLEYQVGTIVPPCPAPIPPPAPLPDNFDLRQRASFFRVWDLLSHHLREITFDLHGPRWTTSVITDLGELLRAFADDLSESKIDFGYLLGVCYLS